MDSVLGERSRHGDPAEEETARASSSAVPIRCPPPARARHRTQHQHKRSLVASTTAAASLPQSNPWTGQKAVEGASEQASAPFVATPTRDRAGHCCKFLSGFCLPLLACFASINASVCHTRPTYVSCSSRRLDLAHVPASFNLVVLEIYRPFVLSRWLLLLLLLRRFWRRPACRWFGIMRAPAFVSVVS